MAKQDRQDMLWLVMFVAVFAVFVVILLYPEQTKRVAVALLEGIAAIKG